MSDTPNTRPSIFDVLAVLPSGRAGQTLTPDELSGYLKIHYDTDGERERNKRHALRDELYRDGGVLFMKGVIDRVFADPIVRELRKKWVEFARFNNGLKRIVNELATVYAEPARRVVDEHGNDNYQAVLDAVRMDETMLQASRLLNLHRALLLGFRVREKPDGTREPVLDIATPANVRAITHPNDDTLVVAWLIRTSYKSARSTHVARWTLWSERESLQLREDLSVIGDSIQPHEFGVIPWVSVTLGPPQAGFWPGCEGEDLVAAHVAIWFQGVLLLKESKSATKATTIQGDGASTARGQALDTEIPNELADGQSTTTTDMSMDLSIFRDTADHVLSNTAQNYGMSAAIVTHQGVQSAEARELMRLPLREIRRQQQIPLRRFERQLAIVMAAVLGIDLPALGFDAASWRMEFAESETPLSPTAEHDLFEKRRAAGLDNSVSFYQRLHPGITPELALDAISTNIAVETERNILMRPLQVISGSLAANLPRDANGNVTKPEETP